MKEYIEREAAIDDISSSLNLADLEGNPVNAKGIRAFVAELINHVPAADVRPVVRGKWIPDYDCAEYDFDGSTPLSEPRKFQDGWQCSLCGQYMPSETNFCPNCGATMEES